MNRVVQDINFAVRSLGKAPGFTAVAVLLLALGIGVNGAIYSVVNAVLLRPLPVAAPERLISVYGRQESEQRFGSHSWPDYVSYRERATTVSDVIAYSTFLANVSDEGRSELVIGELVSDNYFSGFGVRLMLGRAWTPEEAAPLGGAPFAVISHRYWHAHFGGAADVVGRPVWLSGRIYTVVGVADPAFGGMLPGTTAMLWIPVTMAEQVTPFGDQRTPVTSPGTSRFDRRGVHWLSLKARLRPEATAAQARAEFEEMISRLGEEYPALLGKERVAVFGGDEVRIHPIADRYARAASLLLLAAVGLVLVVTCANLTNLTLARAAGREHELTARAALGASRGVLARTLVTESVLLALAGAALAFPVAIGLTSALNRMRPPMPFVLSLEVAPDWRVLVYTLLLALAAAVAFGLVPALRASRPNLAGALKASAGTATRAHHRLRDALVVSQMAVSLVLIVVGALLVRSLFNAAAVPLGYEESRLGFLTVPLQMIGYDTTRGGALLAQGADRLRATPGVEEVALTNRLPLALNNVGFACRSLGRSRPTGARTMWKGPRSTSVTLARWRCRCWRAATSWHRTAMSRAAR